jgi:hypothetical protein
MARRSGVRVDPHYSLLVIRRGELRTIFERYGEKSRPSVTENKIHDKCYGHQAYITYILQSFIANGDVSSLYGLKIL